MKTIKFNFVGWAIAISAVIMFICSSIRHALFQSNFDLAIFDNALYLISQGKTPYITFRGLHILGDHAAYLFYPLACLYRLTANIHWLFASQAFALALAALPICHLARLAQLSQRQANTLVLVYLLYPLVFNVNLFDFHPEVIAIPAILAAVIAAKLNKILWFSLSIAVILGCKAVLALTVAMMGIWLLLFEKKNAVVRSLLSVE